MRVWVPVSLEQFLLFDRDASLDVLTGYAVTQSWAQGQLDQDEEVLEAEILAIASAAKPIVLVVEAAATELPGDSGEVSLTHAVSELQIRAIFASSPQEPDEMLWFGPSERPEVRDFLGLDIGS